MWRGFSDSSPTEQAPLRAKFFVVLLGLALVAATGFAVWRVLRPTQGSTTTQAAVGVSTFSLPSGYFRPGSRAGGRVDKLELATFFPNFAPAGDLSDIVGATDLAERHDKLIFITISEADLTLDPADRPAKLYARFLEPDEWTHPGGLIARGFVAGSPFEGEELYYAAPEGREFAARCGRPDPNRTTPNFCIDDFRLDELNVELRFSANLLSEWEKLIAGARGLIQSGRR
jgi:hypothetical protein